jgi:signal transduction histidine kinase
VSAAALSLAVLLAFWGLAEARRRRRLALREALHELRRPLHALMLERPPGSREGALLAQLRVAVADLEEAVEGRGARAPVRERLTVAELLREAEERWPGAPVAIDPPADGSAAVEGDRVRLGMALDNLIANGLEHGGAGVDVSALADRRRLRLEVVNPEPREAAPPARLPGAPRGNGLRIAARHAAADAGRIAGPQRRAGEAGEDGERIVAAVELPRTDPGPTAA